MVADRIRVATKALVNATPSAVAHSQGLHQFRIKAKQLRHCLELDGMVDSESVFREPYMTARQIQKKLGVMNDHVIATKCIGRIGKSAKSKRYA